MAGWRVLTLLVLVGVSCSSAGPPAGPKYTPSDTAEAATACPKERKHAQVAREELLDSQGEGPRKEAARRVFEHGMCELRALAIPMPPTESHDQILSELRALREKIRDVSSLFREVQQYGQVDWTMRALVQVGALKLAFSRTVAAIEPPADMDASGRAAFRGELREAAQVLRGEARAAVQKALSMPGEVPTARQDGCGLLEEMAVQHPGC